MSKQDLTNLEGQLDVATLNKEFEEMGLDQQYFEALERDFQQVLEDMMGDKSLEKFRQQYEKLHRALKTSYESEKRLVKRCRELHDMMVENAIRIKSAIILTKQDSETINTLKNEVEKAWKLIDVAKEKEEKARGIIQTLRAEIANLNQIVEQGSGLSIGQDNTVHTLMREKEELKDENDKKAKRIAELEELEVNLKQDLSAKESQVAKKLEELSEIQKEYATLKESEKRLERTITTLKKENEKSREDNTKLEQDMKDLMTSKEKVQNELKRQQEQFKSKSTELDKTKQEKSALEQNLENSQKEKSTLEIKIGRQTKDITDQRATIEEQRSTIKDLEKKHGKANKERNQYKVERDRLANQKEEAEEQKELAKNAVMALTREIEALRKHAETGQKDIDNLRREQQNVDKNLDQTKQKNKEKDEAISKLKKEMQTLSNERNNQKREIKTLQDTVCDLEKERDKAGHDAAKSKASLVQIIEELKLKKNLISELKKENAELDAKLKQQQNLYEAVRSDRNLYSKNLIEANDDVAELKRKFRVASHQIQQLKDEIEAKDQALSQEHYALAQEIKDKEKEQASNKEYKKANAELEENQKKMDNEINKLKFIIKEAEEEKLKLDKDYNNVIQERDTLGTQLIRRNDELALLYEKIKILQSTLSKGEKQYQERVEDIRILQFRIADLKSELRIVKKSAS